MEEIASITSPFIALITALVIWFLNERGKRSYQKYEQKLHLYETLIKALNSFYKGSTNIEKRQDFYDGLATTWMYGSEEVIEKADSFLETMSSRSFTNEQKQNALADLMSAIRKDMGLKSPAVKFKTWISATR